jgi:hypothetical protein
LKGVAITGVGVVHRRDSARDLINRPNRKFVCLRHYQTELLGGRQTPDQE